MGAKSKEQRVKNKEQRAKIKEMLHNLYFIVF